MGGNVNRSVEGWKLARLECLELSYTARSRTVRFFLTVLDVRNDVHVGGCATKWTNRFFAAWGRTDLDRRQRWGSVTFGCCGSKSLRTGEVIRSFHRSHARRIGATR